MIFDPTTNLTAAQAGQNVELIHQVRETHGVHAYRRGVKAIQELEELTSKLGEWCAFIRRDSLYLASEPADLRDLILGRHYAGVEVSQFGC
ncbi:MAG: hypothetical protein V4719_00160 [Planctomycetota bacterium]